MEITASIELSKSEAQVLINIIDVAIKSKGLEVAQAGLYLVDKIESSFKNKELCANAQQNVDVTSQKQPKETKEITR